jgi:hypothetical protein
MNELSKEVGGMIIKIQQAINDILLNYHLNKFKAEQEEKLKEIVFIRLQ